MTIKEVEQCTGLPRSVIRFYEKEGLIAPQRNEENRYRAYSQADVDRLRTWITRYDHEAMLLESLREYMGLTEAELALLTGA